MLQAALHGTSSKAFIYDGLCPSQTAEARVMKPLVANASAISKLRSQYFYV